MTRTRLLDIRELETRFATPEGDVRAVNGVSLAIDEGEAVGVVGESGSGKSQLFLSVLGLLARNGSARGSVRFRGEELLGLSSKALNRVRGSQVSMIFQDPMTSLNPYLRIERQLTEVLVEHRGMRRAAARAAAIEQLALVGIPAAEQRIAAYPHELSGGMRQRVMIAMALLCRPALLIADEPTTALDVTIQAQILELMTSLQRRLNTAVVLVTHDMGVVAGLCDRVVVMYGGRIVESGSVRDIFYRPAHPYTVGLLRATPRLDSRDRSVLPTIGGQPPNAQRLPPGCAFYDRCPVRVDVCLDRPPQLRPVGTSHEAACHAELAP